MGRILLLAGAALLAVTAIIHALGQPMVDGWVDGLSHQQKAAICLVWISDSIAWLVVASLWVVAGLSRQRAWIGAATIGTAIPTITAVGILLIDHTFFGGWLLALSSVLALGGIALRRQ